MSDITITLLLRTEGQMGGEELFFATTSERFSASGEDLTILLERAEGFLESEVEFDLVPNLFGSGSFIDSVRTSEKEFTLTLTWRNGAMFAPKDQLLRSLEQHMEAFEKLTLRYQQAGTGGWGERHFEYHDIYITAINSFESIDGNNVRMVLTLLSPSGKKVNV